MMSGVNGLGHFGIAVNDIDKMVDFYTRVLGFTVTDGGGGPGRGVFLSARPEAEHHELVLGFSDNRTNAQRVSLTVASLADLNALYGAIKAEGCTIERTVNRGVSVACLFRDPEDNALEIYWPTGIDYPQPFDVDVELDHGVEDVLDLISFFPPKKSDIPFRYGKNIGKRLTHDTSR
jgi:catechol 2,3-dioxygenase-like lactoylglutathione lyase family enzyme